MGCRRGSVFAQYCKDTLRRHPCKVFELFVAFFKVVQFSYGTYDVCVTHEKCDKLMDPSKFLLVNVLLGTALLAVGQVLNVTVYRAIGKDGVYYAKQFGMPTLPWYEGFPYNVLENPQYVGVIMTCWGIYVILGDSLNPLDIFYCVPWAFTIIYGWSILYEGN